MKIMSKALVGTIAAGAMAVSSATPAFANDRGGVNVGEIIAGALIIGGIAAAVSGGNNGRDYDYRYDRAGYPDQGSYGNYGNYGNNGRYNQYRGNPRQAVEQCIYAAERQAQRYGNGRANVTDIRDVRQTRYGFEVRGRIAVNESGRSWNGDNDRYGRGNDNDRYGRGWNNDNDNDRYGSGWNNDYRGWNENLRGYDSGSFKCRYERGRVYDIDYNGIRGL